MEWPFWWKEAREQARKGRYGSRIVAELEYLGSLPGGDQDARVSAVTDAVAHVAEVTEQSDGVTPEICYQIEERLSSFAEEAKRLTLHCVGHAHLDMNWMWGYDETVVIVMETMRTALRLLEEYPSFTFAQSQGAIYEMIERYEPELLPRIKRFIDEGRWELAATQWTETDMNLPSGESLLRHALYTIRYLQGLFSVDREKLRVAFMPDTFGHSAATPEIFSEAGVKYVYHGRGARGPFVSRWQAPSGRSVLAYQDPRWYNESVDSDLFLHLPELVADYGITDGLSVYGVGDHGGGPTRRDIERIIDMQSWPLAPRIVLSSYHEFFRALEKTENIETTSGERNPVFTGCYSSQSRIKSGNLAGQRALRNAELLGSIAGTLHAGTLEGVWRKLLFTHFHDILPGSGVAETRHHALALYQEVHARTQVEENRALRELARRVQTEAGNAVAAEQRELERTDGVLTDDQAEGAGVGFFVREGRSSATQRWGGPVRPFLVVNTHEHARTVCVEISVWDWTYGAVEVVDAAGTILESEIIRSGEDPYWSHTFAVVLVEVSLEAWQYETVFVRPATQATRSSRYHPYGVDNWLVEKQPDLVLDNGLLRVEIDPVRLSIDRIYDYEGGREVLGAEGAAFVLEFEEPKYMSSWITHRTRSSHLLGSGGTVTKVKTGDARLRESIEVEIPFSARDLSPDQGGSLVRARLELDRGSRHLRVHAEVAFREVTTRDRGLPRLSLRATLPTAIERVVRDLPFGTQQSAPDGVPVAAQTHVLVATNDQSFLMVSKDTQSFAAFETGVSATLLRGSNEPDPVPEIGDHRFELYLGPAPADRNALPAAHALLNEPRVVSVERPRADVNESKAADKQSALRGLLAQIEVTDARVVAIKPAEDTPNALVARCVAENESAPGRVTLTLPASIAKAQVVDAIEHEAASDATVTKSGTSGLTISIPPAQVATVMVVLADRDG